MLLAVEDQLFWEKKSNEKGLIYKITLSVTTLRCKMHKTLQFKNYLHFPVHRHHTFTLRRSYSIVPYRLIPLGALMLHASRKSFEGRLGEFY